MVIVKEQFIFNIPLELKYKSGIYCISNNVDSRIYVGSAKTLWKRFLGHFRKLEIDKHKNRYFQNFYTKHKEAIFTFTLLELVEDLSTLIDREQFWLDETKCYEHDIGFNICPKASSSLGVKRSPEYLAKISGKNSHNFGKKMPEERKLEMSKRHKGNQYWRSRKPFSEETLAKISEASKGNQHWKLRGPYSEETRKKVKEANQIPIILISKDGSFIKEYSGIIDAGKELNIDRSYIVKVCRKKRPAANGHYFQYKSEYLAQGKIIPSSDPYIPLISLPLL